MSGKSLLGESLSLKTRFAAVLLGATTLFQSLCLLAQPLHFSSAGQATDVLELFTSQGCHSCPPADRFFTSLKSRDGLFSEFIPVAFHVDYWNYLGWRDHFSRSEFTFRQRKHQIEGHINSVYTPGFVVNSKEWRGFFKHKKHWPVSRLNAGVLNVDVTINLDNDWKNRQQNNQLIANYQPHSDLLESVANAPNSLTLYVAYLGMGLSTSVSRGENRGKHLHHDFVVLNMQRFSSGNITSSPTSSPSVSTDIRYRWSGALASIPQRQQQSTAIAMWVSPENSNAIWQATGGYLAPDSPVFNAER